MERQNKSCFCALYLVAAMSVSKYMFELNCLLVPIQFTFSAHAVYMATGSQLEYSTVQYVYNNARVEALSGVV